MTRAGGILQRDGRPMGSVNLHLLSDEWELPDPPETFLDPGETERLHQFVFEADARRWGIFRAKAKQVLADRNQGTMLPWIAEPGDKPRVDLPGVDFNLSHSKSLAAIVVSDVGPVGVDLEPLDRAPTLLECADSFCHPEELASLPKEETARARALLDIWTAKEALLKAVGTGLLYPPTEMQIRGDRSIGGPEGSDGLRLLRPIDAIEIGHSLAVATPLTVDSVTLA